MKLKKEQSVLLGVELMYKWFITSETGRFGKQTDVLEGENDQGLIDFLETKIEEVTPDDNFVILNITKLEVGAILVKRKME